MNTFEEAMAYIDSKPTHSPKELKNHLHGIIHSYFNRKKSNIEEIRKYDVISCGDTITPHPVLVYKVLPDFIYGVVFSSTKGIHNVHEVQKDRMQKGKFATATLLTIPIEQAKLGFLRTFESRQEADLIFSKVKKFYKETFKL